MGEKGMGEVAVLIRPEQIALAPITPGAAGGITGKVTEARYDGHDALISVDVTGGACFKCGRSAPIRRLPGTR
jgi:hypothetical protein